MQGRIVKTMASNYNSRYRPAEVLWINEEAHLIRKQENFEDILRNQIELPAAVIKGEGLAV